MLSSEAIGVTLKIAKGIIKLTRQIDLVMAEKQAVQGELALALPAFSSGLTPNEIINELTDFYQNETSLTAKEKTTIADACNNPVVNELEQLVTTYLPDLSLFSNIDLESDFIKKMRKVRPEWVGDQDIMLSAYYIRSGKDKRNKSYKWRLALTVVDVLAEFGAENIALFTKDEKVQNIVGAILQRFGDSDLQKLDTNKAILKMMISATMNGLLDAKENFDIDNKWIIVAIDSLSDARASLPADKQDEFLIGLIEGKSYPLLVGHILSNTAKSLDDTNADAFTKISTDFLKRSSSLLIQTNSTKFSDFFNDHWGDLLRAGFKTVEIHGPGLIEGESPLLAKVLESIAKNLASTENNLFLSSEMLVGIVNASVSTIAENPDLVDEIISQAWLSALTNSIAGSVANAGINAVFTKSGLETMAKDVLKTFAEHPELIVDKEGIPQDLLKSILTEFKGLDSFSAEALAIATVSSSLKTISEHPELIKFKYPELIASIAGKTGLLVKAKKISKIQGVDLIGIISTSLAENPKLFNDLGSTITSKIIDLVVSLSKEKNALLISGATLLNLVQNILANIATYGRTIMADLNNDFTVLIDQFETVLKAGLAEGELQLGKLIGVRSISPVLAELIKAWAKGELTLINLDDNNFKILFKELAEKQH